MNAIRNVHRLCLGGNRLLNLPPLLNQSTLFSTITTSSLKTKLTLPQLLNNTKLKQSCLQLSSSAVLNGGTDRFIVGKSKVKVPKQDYLDKSSDEVVNLDALMEEESAKQEMSQEFKTFSDEMTPDQLFNGIKFKDLPHVLLRLHKNNTRLIALHADGRPIFACSPAKYGFLHAKKRTSVAGQVAGLNMGQKLRGLGIRTIRVRINGFNQARIETVKGIAQAGINIVAIADVTTIDWGWSRRAKAKPSKN